MGVHVHGLRRVDEIDLAFGLIGSDKGVGTEIADGVHHDVLFVPVLGGDKIGQGGHIGMDPLRHPFTVGADAAGGDVRPIADHGLSQEPGQDMPPAALGTAQ